MVSNMIHDVQVSNSKTISAEEKNSKMESQEEAARVTSVAKPANDDKLESSTSSNESYRTTIQHVKGTLMMFLKKTPIIDTGNEMLLKIIYSMLMFTQAEIQELNDAR